MLRTNILSNTDKIDSTEAKFDLYLKTREIGQIAKVLHKLDFTDIEERNAWIKDNEVLIEEMLDDFMDDSVSLLEDQTLDTEALQLSMDLIKNLRETSELLQNLLYDSQDNPTSDF